MGASLQMAPWRRTKKAPPIRHWLKDTHAAAAVEFSLLLPIMLMMLALAMYGGEGFSIQNKVSLSASTVTDIVSQYSTISNATLANVLNVASATITPYGTANLSLVVSEIQTNNSGAGTVVWSKAAFNGTALATGGSFTLPTALALPNTYYIYGSAQYVYTPMNVYQSLAQITISDASYMPPRVSTSIALTP